MSLRSRAAGPQSLFLIMFLLLTAPLGAQEGQEGQEKKAEFNLLNDLGGPEAFGPLGGPSIGDHAEFEAWYTYGDEGKGTLFVKATIEPTWHVYSITQKDGGPQKSELKLAEGEKVKLAGAFASDRDPEVKNYEFFPVPVEEHAIEVIWKAPIELPKDVDPAKHIIKVDYAGQVCQDNGSCIPIEKTLEAKGKAELGAVQVGAYQGQKIHAKIEGFANKSVVRPGGSFQLVFKAIVEKPFHIYEFSNTQPPKAAYKPTLLIVDKKSGTTINAPVANSEVQVKDAGVPGYPPLRYHEGDVAWSVEVQVPKDAEPGDMTLAGRFGYQTCTDKKCDEPHAVSFEVTVAVGETDLQKPAPFTFATIDYAELEIDAPKAQFGNSNSKAKGKPLSAGMLAQVIVFSLLGGLILNLMPCVLPVIGLKVLSFVEQAGEERGKVLALNLWYVAGLMFVFLILATLAAVANLGWGEQFTYTWFKVAMTALVFAMALSFLGVWEIPIPGFAGSGTSAKLQTKEGASGAFFKGMFTTILATPCSGPFLGPLFGYTLSQPASITYLIFTCVGLGMGSPYLLIGAFPKLVKFLPRPGAWMETFKEVMGFVLLATVVYLFTTISSDYFIATLTLLVGLWFGCWWIGRTPITATSGRKSFAWIGGAGVAALVGAMAFQYLGPHKDLLPWKPYTTTTLAQAQAEGKTVMVDFTADWCLTCKVNLYTAIDTKRVQSVVEENGVVPLLADWTDRNATIKQSLAKLNAHSIPLLAIYPAGRPEDVIVLQDSLVESQVVEALKKAGPSKTKKGAKVARAP